MRTRATQKSSKRSGAFAQRPKASSGPQTAAQKAGQAEVLQLPAEQAKARPRAQRMARDIERAVDAARKKVVPSPRRAQPAKTQRKNGRVLKPFPVVGIGASAGGLEAMTQLLRHLPRDTGMAFVLVQHLDPTHESQLTSLLSRTTSIQVSEARHNAPLQPNHLYIIPPNRMMGVSGRKLRLLPRKGAKDVRTPIDYFLRSLAEEEGPSAIGVLLSGNGSDGTLGLQAIKAGGGITFAQDEVSAKYSPMPANAIAARCVDFVLTPDKMARELSRIADHPYVTPSDAVKRDALALTEERPFEDILTSLRHRTGVDFTHYKHATLERRIQRRMVLHRFDKLQDYARYVRSHAAETKELFNDVLIHVTSFFRDPPVFAALKRHVFPRLVKTKGRDEPIRIWIPGCSTGEEVYSIAIALVESLSERPINIPIQIFGTDINDLALEQARAGVYAECIHEAVSPERLRRFFMRHQCGYRINKSIRELCIFARQNVVADPPFSNLDFISCRNVLIYLGQPLQRKIVPVFHYALRPTGLLMLGASETIGSFAEMFQLLDKKAKIYSKRAAHLRPHISFAPFQPLPTSPAEPLATLVPSVADIQQQTDRILLTHYCPAGVVINQAMEVVQFRGRTGLFLEHAHGEANLNVIKMARNGLGVELRAAVSKAMKRNTRVRHEGGRVEQNGHSLQVSIEVVPFQTAPSHEYLYLVLLQATRPPALDEGPRKPRGKKGRSTPNQAELENLREELSGTRDSLQAIIEEQEATNEELRSANEEIMSSNEELQSTNEELETAKEELQSTNEELTTLNEELETRNIEVTHVNNDLHNVMVSVNIPMLLLGRDMRIRRFTGAAERMFNLLPSDVGRPLSDIAIKLDVPDLTKVVREVIDSLATKEFETRDKDGRYWSARVRPYKTIDNKIDGAIVALFDINVMKADILESEAARAFADGIINAVREPLIVLDENLVIKFVNASFLNMFQVNAKNSVTGQPLAEVGKGLWKVPQLPQMLADVLTRKAEFNDFEIQGDFPQIGQRRIFLSAQCLDIDRDRDKRMILLSIKP